MMTVDEILATGRYTDRRGRVWRRSPYQEWVHSPNERFWVYTPREMRLLIERDLHRDECPGLRLCRSHPVPNVLALQDDISVPKWGHGFGVYRPGPGDDREAWLDTLPAAMDAARALAVRE